MVARGRLFVLFAAAMTWTQVAGAQPASPAPDVRGGAPVQVLAPAPGDSGGGGLFALDLGAADPAVLPGPGGGQRMGRRPGMRGGPGMGRGPGMAERPAELARELKLTGEQREKLAEIQDRQMRKSIQARADLALERLDLRRLLRAETPSLTAIGAQIDKIARTRAELAKSRAASLLEMRNVLTAEQRKLLRERSEVTGGRMMGRGFGGNGHGQGMSQEGGTE